ncbi:MULTISPECIES: YcxB family protein [unclassified Rhizobium]|nr:YcxB family protein [Rhizobium sp. L58/93]MBO9170480.1 YcxB family protein [Rhizobium sp. L245/93]MBO9186405.1 YcxB family protein [Rhizobium sp. E27B/91]QXZ86275.1 YcxB family protein [Rhizobium sp. K1/93]QXZ92270.1 YcxB family protein [Rhizobium sp. K15/93]QYA04514.1 YcxB family protein [Rhizobium sp. B21/90]
MTQDEVSYTYRWEDVLAANRLRMQTPRRRRIVWTVLALMGVAETALGLVVTDVLLIGLGLFSCLAYPMWRLALHYWLLPRHSRRYYKQAAVLQEPITVAWSALGLATQSRMVTTSMPWSAYIGRLEDDAILLFLQTDALYQFIPKRALSPDQVQQLRAAAASVPCWRHIAP